MGLFVHKQLTILLSAVGLASAAAWGQDDPLDLTSVPFEKLLETDVITASRIAKQISDSPSAVAIVTADDIRTFGYRTLADVINSMRGLYTTSDRRYEYLGGRGFGVPGDYAGRIMVLVDGTATQDNIYNQAFIDHSGLLDMAVIDRVEYVPGTGSVTYGNNALLGIINIVTKSGRDFNTGQLSTELFSYGGVQKRFTFGQRFDNGVDLVLSASALRYAGQSLYFPYFDAIGRDQGREVGQDYERNRRYFAKLAFDQLVVQAAYVTRTKASPLPKRENAFNRNYTVADESTSVNARYDRDISETLKSSTRAYYGAYKDNAFREYGDDDPDEMYRLNRVKGQWWGVDQKFVATGIKQHTFVLGAEFRNDFHQQIGSVALRSDFSTAFVYSDSRYDNKTLALYVTDEFAIIPNLFANIGVRYDKPNAVDYVASPGIRYAHKALVSPRIALNYLPDDDTTIKASYSEAFRLPNPHEIGATSLVNELLFKPESVAATEVVLQHDFSPTSRFVGSIYQYRQGDQRYTDSYTGNTRFDGLSKTHGLEVQLDHELADGLKIRSSAAWQHAVDAEGNWLSNSPHQQAKLNLSLPVLENAWRLGIEGQYLGARMTAALSDDDGVVYRAGRRLPSQQLVHLTLSSSKKWQGMSASIGIRNVLDRKNEVPTSSSRISDDGVLFDAIQMDGRTFWLQLNVDILR